MTLKTRIVELDTNMYVAQVWKITRWEGIDLDCSSLWRKPKCQLAYCVNHTREAAELVLRAYIKQQEYMEKLE
jgi:hypothetical protein